MSFDAKAEKAAIIARAALRLVGGRVYRSVPDDEDLPKDNLGNVLPYIIIGFGNIYASATDRSLMGAETQPMVLPVIFECWAKIESVASDVAGGVRPTFVGWHPTEDNATEMTLRGGGSFQNKNSTGRPTRFMESVTMETTINMSTGDPFNAEEALEVVYAALAPQANDVGDVWIMQATDTIAEIPGTVFPSMQLTSSDVVNTDTPPLRLGTLFTVSETTVIDSIRFFSPTVQTGCVVELWVAGATNPLQRFTRDVVAGENVLMLPAAAALAPDTQYIAAVGKMTGASIQYSSRAFAAADLHAPFAADAAPGRFSYSTGVLAQGGPQFYGVRVATPLTPAVYPATRVFYRQPTGWVEAH